MFVYLCKHKQEKAADHYNLFIRAINLICPKLENKTISIPIRN